MVKPSSNPSIRKKIEDFDCKYFTVKYARFTIKSAGAVKLRTQNMTLDLTTCTINELAAATAEERKAACADLRRRLRSMDNLSAKSAAREVRADNLLRVREIVREFREILPLYA